MYTLRVVMLLCPLSMTSVTVVYGFSYCWQAWSSCMCKLHGHYRH